MKMRPWFPSDSGSTVSPVRRARSKRGDPGCPTSEAGVSVREGCRGSDGPRDGRAAAQLHRGGRGPGTGAVTVCARRPAAVRPAARRPRRSSGTAQQRADASPLGPEPSPVEGTSLRAPPQPLAPHLPTKRTRTKLASVREEPLLTMLTRNRTKGQSSSDAQNSQFRSAQGRRGGTMGVPGKVPVLQYCSWKASWGRRGGLSARPRGPGSSELRVLQAPGAVPLPHLAVPAVTWRGRATAALPPSPGARASPLRPRLTGQVSGPRPRPRGLGRPVRPSTQVRGTREAPP